MAPVLESNLDGYWGKPTATIDWCEANYEVTVYIAEFWNTISNFFMIVPPLVGAIYCKHDGLEDRNFLCLLFLAFVGIGSWCFHGTLLYEMQLMDELPMIWGSAILIYAFVEVDSPKGRQNYGLMIALFLYCLVVTLVYLVIKQPVFHEIAYALMVFTLVITSVRTARKYECLIHILILSCVLYGTGFFIWNLDNIFCSNIKQLRQTVGYPLKPILQGHAWWHVLTGIGAYLSFLFCVDARSRFLKEDLYFQKFLWVWPFARRPQQKRTEKVNKRADKSQ